MDYDITIIGAGVVGLAIASLISKKYSTLIVERHPGFGWETSSRNSEVIHAGIYFGKDTLKGKFCIDGNKSMYEYLDKHKIPYDKCGKYIVAANSEEEEMLEDLYDLTVLNSLKEIVRIDAVKLKAKEPYVKALAALYSPATGVIDSHLYMQSLELEAIDNGCDIVYNHEVRDIEKEAEGYRLLVYNKQGDFSEIKSRILINSAGLDSDRIASIAGIDIKKEDYELTYCKGHYFRINYSKKYLANSLIYPVPMENMHGVGIHITRELDGSLKIGPDAVYLNHKFQDYNIPPELKDKFYKAASIYLPELEYNDIYPDQAGIRPKLQKKGGPPRDFLIKEESDKGFPGLINLIGIESPGLTSSLEIAKFVNTLI